jgi:adenylylsulfate kinase
MTQALQTPQHPKGRAIVLRGLPGSGKTTLANQIVATLRHTGVPAFHVNADTVRASLNSDLGFDPASRIENARRIGSVLYLASLNGLLPVVDFVMPSIEARSAFNVGASGTVYDLYTVTREHGFQCRFSDTQSIFDATPLGVTLHYPLKDIHDVVEQIIARSTL